MIEEVLLISLQQNKVSEKKNVLFVAWAIVCIYTESYSKLDHKLFTHVFVVYNLQPT